MADIVFKKVCANTKCKYGFDFTSTSRNQKYCCEECAQIAKGVLRKKQKHRAKKRKEYDENKDINRALNRAYGASHVVADEVYKISQKCACCGAEPKVVDGQQVNELHHKDLNPFNASPWNMVYLCKSCHKRLHDKTEDISMVETYKEAVLTEDPISYMREKLSGIRSYDEVIEEVRRDLCLTDTGILDGKSAE